ncbi:HlyD family secretion protein [bacterium]|nr:HlyD family secretion protein [bacterium]
MRAIRTIATWLVVIGLFYLGYRFIWPLFAPEEEETDIQTTVVKRGDLRLVVPADGVVVPRVLVEVKSKASGVVEAVLVEPGDQMEPGEVIVELDKEVIRSRLRQAEADLAASQAQLKLTERSLSPQQKASAESSVRQAQIDYDRTEETYERISELYDRGYATKAERNDAELALESAKERLSQAKQQLELDLQGPEPERIEMAKAAVLRRQAELDNVREELANTTIRSPMKGTVLERPVEIGTAVASGTSGATGGTVVATIGDLSTLYVRAYIDETDLGRVTIGMPCRVTFDSYTGWLWDGALAKIYPQGEASGGGNGFGGGGGGGARFRTDIEIDLTSARKESGADASGGGGWRQAMGQRSGMSGSSTNPGGHSGRGGEKDVTEGGEEDDAAKPEPPRLYAQMSANVEAVIEDHPSVLILPAQYIKYEEGKPYCEVQTDPEDDSKRERRELELGFSDGLRHEVVSGLEEGDTVVLERPISRNSRY